MPRARLLKPGFFTNEDLLELPFAGRLLFAGLWTIADRAGRLEDRPKRIKIDLFPADDVDVNELLGELQAYGFIHRYTVDGQRLIHVKAFLSHQSPHPREPASKWPPCHCEGDSPVPDGGEQAASNGPDSDEPSTGPAVAVAVADNGVLGSSSGSAVSSEAETVLTGAAVPRKTPRLIPLTDEERLFLFERFPFPGVAEQIDLALSHKAHKNYPENQIGYVRNWLRRWADEKGFDHRPPAVVPPLEQASKFQVSQKEAWLRGHIREHGCGHGCASEAYEEAHGRVPA